MIKGLKSEIKKLYIPKPIELFKRGGFVLGIAFVVSCLVGSYGMLCTKVISLLAGI